MQPLLPDLPFRWYPCWSLGALQSLWQAEFQSSSMGPCPQKSMLFKQHNPTSLAFTFPYPRFEHNWVIALAFSSLRTPTLIWHLYKGTIHLQYGAVQLYSRVVTQYLGHTHTKQLFIVYLTSQISLGILYFSLLNLATLFLDRNIDLFNLAGHWDFDTIRQKVSTLNWVYSILWLLKRTFNIHLFLYF